MASEMSPLCMFSLTAVCSAPSQSNELRFYLSALQLDWQLLLLDRIQQSNNTVWYLQSERPFCDVSQQAISLRPSGLAVNVRQVRWRKASAFWPSLSPSSRRKAWRVKEYTVADGSCTLCTASKSMTKPMRYKSQEYWRKLTSGNWRGIFTILGSHHQNQRMHNRCRTRQQLLLPPIS